MNWENWLGTHRGLLLSYFRGIFLETEYNHENPQASRSGLRFELETTCIRWIADTHATAAFCCDFCCEEELCYSL
jgi:hypothetical protein